MAQAFLDLLLFIQIVLTVPVAPASAERSSSALRRVKNLGLLKVNDVAVQA